MGLVGRARDTQGKKLRGPGAKPWGPANLRGRTEKESDEEEVANKVGGKPADRGNSKARKESSKKATEIR